jgi:hypothetical protein
MQLNVTTTGTPRRPGSADGEDALRAVEQSPGTSTRRLACRHYISQWTVVRVLQRQIYPFHVQQVQSLQPPLDYERRRAFCEWLLQRDAASPTFLSWVLLMDDACFTRNWILDTRNQHTWADENKNSFQETLAINVRTVVIGYLLLGPYELPPRLSRAS